MVLVLRHSRVTLLKQMGLGYPTRSKALEIYTVIQEVDGIDTSVDI